MSATAAVVKTLDLVDDPAAYLGGFADYCSESDACSEINDALSEEGFEMATSHALHAATPVASASPYLAQPTSNSHGVDRHRVYDLRVMPPWAYHYTLPPRFAVPEQLFEDPVTEVALGDAGDALIFEYAAPEETDCWANNNSMSRTPAAYAARAVAVPEAMEVFPEAVPSPPRRAAAAARPRAAQPAGVMCCYWKRGSCSMGDSCWYSHEGTADTPCHYGVTCRKGHRDLVRTNGQAPPRDTRPAAERQAANHAGAGGADAVPKRYVHEPRSTRPSAPLVPTDLPCPHCGAEGAVSTQEFPYFERGVQMRTALRGHCSQCLRTFMLA
jgi:hypothetical protein